VAAGQWRRVMLGWALRYGNGYAEIEVDNANRPVWLHPLHPSRVEPRVDGATGEMFYRIANGRTGAVDLDASRVFHLRGFGDGPVGLNVVQYAAESIGWAQATEVFGAAFFGNGMNMAVHARRPHPRRLGRADRGRARPAAEGRPRRLRARRRRARGHSVGFVSPDRRSSRDQAAGRGGAARLGLAPGLPPAAPGWRPRRDSNPRPPD
jgi:hypothetical protein